MSDPVDDSDSEISDDDPEVVAGMARLAELRKLERDVIEFEPPKYPLK